MARTSKHEAEAARVYGGLLHLLRSAGLPFLVGGSYAFTLMTGIPRPTKDLDIFIRRSDWARLAQLAAVAGWQTELSYPHWLGKLLRGEHFVDAIFNSGNGLTPVDDSWFEHAIAAHLLGQPVQLVPLEEALWTKAFVMERERFDGADVTHLLRACGSRLNWHHLLQRFDPHWRVLFAHLVLFGFVYPGHRAQIPAWLINELSRRVQVEAQYRAARPRLCAGTLISREQYLPDVLEHGYQDARLLPSNPMSADDIAIWTTAIAADRPDSAEAETP